MDNFCKSFIAPSSHKLAIKSAKCRAICGAKTIFQSFALTRSCNKEAGNQPALPQLQCSHDLRELVYIPPQELNLHLFSPPCATWFALTQISLSNSRNTGLHESFSCSTSQLKCLEYILQNQYCLMQPKLNISVFWHLPNQKLPSLHYAKAPVPQPQGLRDTPTGILLNPNQHIRNNRTCHSHQCTICVLVRIHTMVASCNQHLQLELKPLVEYQFKMSCTQAPTDVQPMTYSCQPMLQGINQI